MKNSTRLLLVLALSTALNTAYAQCTKKTDEMSKKVSIETKKEKIGSTGVKGLNSAMFLEANMSYRDGIYLLSLLPQFNDIQTIQAGSDVYFKFEDDSVFSIKTDKTDISEHTSGQMFTQGSNSTIWYNILVFSLSREQVAKVKDKKLVKVRVQNNDYVVKGKNQEVLQNWIGCIDKSK